MEGFELSIMINRPIEEVFEALTYLENDIKWRSEWVEPRNTSGGALGVGATFCLTGEFLGRRVPMDYEVIEYQPNLSAAGMSCKKFPKRQRTTTRCFSKVQPAFNKSTPSTQNRQPTDM